MVVNWLNLSTPLGLLVARIGGAVICRHGRGMYLAVGYRWRFPAAGAFTVGSVIVSRHGRPWLLARPALLTHEDRHCTQFAWFIGPVMLPLYLVGVAVSWIIAGNHHAYNPFERFANLAEGGYPPPMTRRTRRRRQSARQRHRDRAP